jgi:hypothetical protein
MLRIKNKTNAFSEKLDKKQQSLIQSISYYLGTDENMKNSPVVNIRSAKHTVSTKEIKIGFTTLEGKYGSALEKLKKTNRGLSDYLFGLDLFFKPPKIVWNIEKEDDRVDKVKHLIDKIEKDLAKETEKTK